MSSRKLSKPIAIGGVSLILLAGGGYGIVNANSGSGSNTATAASAQVIPFDRGNPSPAKVVGQVPQGWTAGSGKIASATAANKAKAVAIAAYPGGTVNRVVLLSNDNYNVHIIGVNWPHHVFVNSNFKVIGAE
jgi:hypothetical protein